MNKSKIRINENMVKELYSEEQCDFSVIYIVFNDKIKNFLKTKSFSVGYIKKPTSRKLYVTNENINYFPIETESIKVMFYKTVGFYIKFDNERDFVKFKLKFN